MISSLFSLYIALQISPDKTFFSEQEGFKEPAKNKHYFEVNSLINLNKNQPQKDPFKIAPVVDASSAIVVDLNSAKVLFEKNSYERLPIASITKLMTALIIVEENDLNEIVTVSQNAASIGGSTMFLQANEEITVENLLHGLLINSGNDAAIALAEHNSGDVETFVEKMNKRARELGLANTNYTNPTGLDDINNYSSADDIAKLGTFIYRNPSVKEIVKTQEIKVQDLTKTKNHNLNNTNQLLDSYLKVLGLKTGRTEAAGQCLTAISENSTGKKIITVVLNSPDRFQETKAITDWTFRSYIWP
jgi:D-alanyl-D-alanine carboxypeptidase (penicillin-binding protein 5/6)